MNMSSPSEAPRVLAGKVLNSCRLWMLRGGVGDGLHTAWLTYDLVVQRKGPAVLHLARNAFVSS